MPAQRFPLKPMWGMMLFAVLLFGGGAVLFTYRAATDERGVVINGLIHLGPSGARIFYVVLAALSATFVAFGIVGNARLIGGKHAVILDDETATFPGTMFRPATKTFAYKDIRSVVTQNVAGTIFVTVTHRGGKAAVAKRTLADGAFETIVSTLETRAEVGPPVPSSRV